jgi:hypothetical protein
MNLKTLIFIFFSLVLIATLATGQTTPYNKLDKLKVNDLIAGKLEVQSTSKSSLPCPSMTQVQRDAIVSPQDGSCVYNNDTNVLNIYNGTEWVEVGSGGGGGGGIANWETAKFYEVGDVVIESNKIYQCNTQHTSSVFATDIANWTKLVAPISLTTEVSGVLPMANGGTDKALTPELGGIVYTDGGSMEVLGAGTLGQLLKSNGAAAPEWTTLSVDDATFSGVLSLGKGGTNKSLTASNGAIAYSDADSIELLAPGTAGQILQSNGVGAPSYVNKSISGKNENGSTVTLEEIQVSNNQLTQTDVNKHLLESGNSNILANPSFEHSTVSTSWTSSAGTLAEDLSVVVNGKKSLSVTLSTQALAVTQDSTLYAAQFADGVQGLASVRVKTSLSGIRVCSRQAGVTSTTNCVNVQGNGKWGLYKVPMILGATSNGISIASNGTSLTGTVYLDDAFVGAVDLKTDVPTVVVNSASASGAINAGTQFSGTFTIFGSPSLFTQSSGVITFTKRAAVSASFSLTSSTTTTVIPSIEKNNVSQSGDNTPVVSGNRSSSSYDSIFEIGDTLSFENSSPGNASASSISFVATSVENGSVYSSTNADTDWASCGHTTSSFTGFGTVSAIETQCKRQGGDLLMKGKFTSGVSTAAEARLSLPVWDGVQLVSAGNPTIPTIQFAGYGVLNASTATQKTMLIEPSVSYFTFSQQSATTSGLSKANGLDILSNGNTYSFNARIPIAGWQQSNIIIGQFNGLESCTNTLECTDTFSASITETGVVSQENINWIDGNCSVTTGNFTCNYIASLVTQPMNCVTTDLSALTSPTATRVYNTTSTGFQASNTAGRGIRVICQKQGVDYIGKLAKAVASDQNVRTPGETKVVNFSLSYGTTNLSTPCSTSPCLINQVGSVVSSVTRTSTGSYTVNFVNSMDKVHCAYGSGTSSAGDAIISYGLSSCSSPCSNITFSTRQASSVATLRDSYGSIVCTGVQQ